MNKIYQSDVCVLKKYGDKKFKLTLFRSLRVKGLQESESLPWIRGTKNQEKLEQSISRARSTVFELAFCNDWDFFCTFTLDSKKFNRYDLKAFSRAFSRFISKIRNETEKVIEYLIIPESHKDGAWHLHGFIRGVPIEQLKEFTLDDFIPIHIIEKLQQGLKVYDWKNYKDTFGWVNLEPIKNKEAASKYVTKYISKNLQSCVKELNANLYYCSKGLKRAEEIKRGILSESIPFVWENDYIKIAWLKDKEKAVKLIL